MITKIVNSRRKAGTGRGASHALSDPFRSAGVKLTQQRLDILAEVAGRRDHPSVDAVYRAVRRRRPTVSLDTVYRTLRLLAGLGLVEPVGGGADRMRIETCRERHHHFVCTACGAIHDFVEPGFDRLAAPAAVAALGRVDRAQVEFRGLCSRCLAASVQVG